MRKPIVILLSGVSSSGKTTFAKKLRKELRKLNLHFEHMEADSIAKKVRTYNLRKILSHAVRPAKEGKDIILDGILPYNNKKKSKSILKSLKAYSLVYVGVYSSLNDLIKREINLNNRTKGWAKKQFVNLHINQKYDLRINTSKNSFEENSKKVIDYLNKNFLFVKR